MRPSTIKAFEALMFGTLGLGVLQASISWKDVTTGVSPMFTLSVLVITFAMMSALTLLIARKRSKIAKWILVVLFISGLPVVLKLTADGQLLGMGLITAAQTLGQLVALGFLFSQSARDWFDRSLDASEIASEFK